MRPGGAAAANGMVVRGVFQSADLVEIFRGNPPEEPERFYRLTRDGDLLRRAGGIGFQKVKRMRVFSGVRSYRPGRS